MIFREILLRVGLLPATCACGTVREAAPKSISVGMCVRRVANTVEVSQCAPVIWLRHMSQIWLNAYCWGSNVLWFLRIFKDLIKGILHKSFALMLRFYIKIKFKLKY